MQWCSDLRCWGVHSRKLPPCDSPMPQLMWAKAFGDQPASVSSEKRRQTLRSRPRLLLMWKLGTIFLFGQQFFFPLRIHGTGIFTYISLKFRVNVGKYINVNIPYMDPMGLTNHTNLTDHNGILYTWGSLAALFFNRPCRHWKEEMFGYVRHVSCFREELLKERPW